MTGTPVLPPATPRVQVVADGAIAVFDFPFTLFAVADLQIYLGAAPQMGGFAVTGIGDPLGGAVTFDSAPVAGTLVTLARRLTIGRDRDFLESGPLSARTLNSQLDRLTAIAQELAADQAATLHYPLTDAPAGAELPSRSARAGRLLGFDGAGNPIAVAPSSAGPMPPVLATGAGAVARPLINKLGDIVSVRDFGAVGDGVTDDTGAIQAALAAHPAVFLPAGTYRTTGTLTLGHGQSLFGVGEASVIQARAAAFNPADWIGYPSGFNAVEMVAGYATLRDLRIVGGASGIKLFGRDGPAVKNVVENISIWDTLIGIVLDGYDNPDRPCYWNHFARVLIARPNLHGVLMTVEGAGDTPNANKFHDVRVYSLAAPLSGCGFFLSAARFHNSFVDCEANLHPGGTACFRLGAATDETRIINFYAESSGALPGIRIDNGSTGTSIVNLFSATAGAPIWDTTAGRNYTAVNAGFPLANDLKATRISDLSVEGLRLDTDYVEPPSGGLVEADLSSCTTFFVSAFGGAVEFRLPAPGPQNGRPVTVKKTDGSANPVTVTAVGVAGPDGAPLRLASRFDTVTVVSNGAGWWITGCNVMPANTEFVEGAGVFTPDLMKPLYLVSAGAGEKEVRLPPASAGAGRLVTIKKSDTGDHAVLVTEDGGAGPDGRIWRLGKRYDFVTVLSNGGSWWVTGARALPATAHYHEAAGLLTLDLRADLYTVSAYAGPVEARLPTVAAIHAGARVTIKKVDATASAVTVTVAGGGGPDGAAVALTAQHQAVTVMCDGAFWRVVARL